MTRTRTISGARIVRRQYPNHAQALNSASGGVRTVYFALSDDIYAGSTITGVTAAAGYYGAAPAGNVAGITNGSALAYPKPQFAWINTQHERVTGAGYAVEAVAFHRHAMNGQQVACVQYQAHDAQGTPNLSAVATASVPALSVLQTQGNIAEVWAADVALAGLTQGDLCRVNARVFPWIGDSAAVLDLIADGVAVTGAVATINPQTPLRFVCDASGAWGGAHALVKPGGTASGTGKVAASYGALGGALADAYPTIQAAVAAIQGWNSANRARNNHSGGTVWLGEDSGGAGAAHAIGDTSASVAGPCWTDIKVDPAASGAVKAVLTATRAQCGALRWQVPIEVSGNFALNGFGGTSDNLLVALENMTLSYTAAASTPIGLRFGHGSARNVTITGGANAASPFAGFSTTRTQMRAVGVVANDVVSPTGGNAKAVYPWVLIGCRFANWNVADGQWAAAVNLDSLDGGVTYNTSFMKLQQACTWGASGPGYGPRGAAIVQNIFERSTTAATAASGLSNDGLAVPADNVNEHHNSYPGTGAAGANIARTNRLYSDAAAAAGVQKRMTSRFNIFHDFNVKTDTFTTITSVTGRTGNWRYRYQVGCEGNVCVLGGDDGTTAPSPVSWLGDHWPASSKPGAATVTYAAFAAGTAGAGGGDYALTGVSNDAYGRVASGQAALRYDLSGTVRRHDGTGAAGAYERTI